SGVSTGADLAYWVGNPLLNPAVLVFLALVIPWQYVVTRVVMGIVVAVGATALIGRWLGGRTDAIPKPPVSQHQISALPGRFARSLSRYVLVLVPEHLVMVFLMGLLGPWLTGVFGLEASIGGIAVLIAAVVGTVLVIPTGGEIPIIAALLAAGAGVGTTGALLVALPALSIPSIVMVGQSLGWRATTAMTTAVAIAAVLAGGLLRCCPDNTAAIASTAGSFCKDVVSPKVSPVYSWVRMRRMILPERVLGTSGTKTMSAGLATGPMCLVTSWVSSVLAASSWKSPRATTNAMAQCPVLGSGTGVTPASITLGWDTRADSISMVDNRWPEILMTSSMRPSIQISSSSSTLAPSPAKNQPRPSSAQ